MAGRHHKILVLSKHLDLGGAERLLADALPYLDRGRFEYHFAYFLSDRDFLVPRFLERGFSVHCLEMAGNAHFPLILPRLDRLQRQHHFDLVHSHLPLPGIAARSLSIGRRLPVVHTEHNLLERCSPPTLWATRLTYSRNDCVFAVSQGVRDSIARFGLDKRTRVETLLNGVPVEQVRAEARDLDGLRQELGIPPDHLVVGTVAVLTGQKRLGDWLEVAGRIAGEREDVTFVLAGSGPEEGALRARVEALGLSGRVRMPGFRGDGRRVLGLVDVYLMTSEYEGLPMALLEAMALGKAVVCTAVGGIPEVVQGGVQGLLAPVGAVDELAGHTRRLLADAALRAAMGRRGAGMVEDGFHCRDRIRRVEAVYGELLHGHPA